MVVEPVPALSQTDGDMSSIPTPELLTKITSTVYYHAPLAKPSATSTSPSAVLIFGWMGAPIRHLTKFAEYYAKAFPASAIIVILSPSSIFLASENNRRDTVRPAFTALQALGVPPSNVLVHIFSNGGIHVLRTFVSLTPDHSFTPHALVIDSAPGRLEFSAAMAANTANIKNPVVKLIASIIFTLIYIFIISRDSVLRKEPVLDGLGRFLNDGAAIGTETKRLYLYSDKDELVQKDSVEQHAHQAREKGYSVSTRNFGETRHVGHMRANPEMYWDAILEVWNE
jgi:hypothetical protein